MKKLIAAALALAGLAACDDYSRAQWAGQRPVYMPAPVYAPQSAYQAPSWADQYAAIRQAQQPRQGSATTCTPNPWAGGGFTCRQGGL